MISRNAYNMRAREQTPFWRASCVIDHTQQVFASIVSLLSQYVPAPREPWEALPWVHLAPSSVDVCTIWWKTVEIDSFFSGYGRQDGKAVITKINFNCLKTMKVMMTSGRKW